MPESLFSLTEDFAAVHVHGFFGHAEWTRHVLANPEDRSSKQMFALLKQQSDPLWPFQTWIVVSKER